MFADRSHAIALVQALFVTVLWSSSWVLIKLGLQDLAPLTFAGLRYGLAALILVASVAASGRRRAALVALPLRTWAALSLLGVVAVTFTQGAQFVALAHLPAVTLSLVLSCTPVVIAAVSGPLLGESPTRLQATGTVVFVAGAWIYFGAPRLDSTLPTIGLVAAAVGLASNACGSLLGRRINRARPDAVVVTAVSMTVGATLLLGAGLATEGWPRLDGRTGAIVAWLALVNTALAFTLWNRSLRHLSATESSVVNNTMTIQIAILAVVFLGEHLTLVQGVGLVVATGGAFSVQLRR